MATEREIQDVINTLIAEGIGEGEEGMRRIAETILNRAEQRGISPAEVVRERAQYTGYSNPGPGAIRAQRDPAAISAAQAAWQLAQGPDDPTNGANHYWNPNVVSPSWANSMQPLGQYGNHAFATDRPDWQRPAPRVAPIPASVEDRVTARNVAASNNYQTAQRNMVTPASVEDRVTARNRVPGPSAFNGDPLTPSNGPVVATIPSRSASQSLFNGDPMTPAAGRVVATIPSNGGPATSIRPSVPVNTGSSSANIASARAEQAVQRVSIPRTTSPATAQAPATAARMNDIGSMPSFSAMSSLMSAPTSAQIQAATGFRGATSIPDRLSPSPAGLPSLYGTMTPAQVSQIGVPSLAPPAVTPSRTLPVIPRPAIAPTVARTAPTPFARPAFNQPAIAPSIPRALPSIAPQPILRQQVAPVQSPLTIRVVGSNTIPYPQPKPQTITNQQRVQNGRDAVSQSGDTSVGNQREAAEARSSGSGGRTRRY